MIQAIANFAGFVLDLAVQADGAARHWFFVHFHLGAKAVQRKPHKLKLLPFELPYVLTCWSFVKNTVVKNAENDNTTGFSFHEKRATFIQYWQQYGTPNDVFDENEKQNKDKRTRTTNMDTTNTLSD